METVYCEECEREIPITNISFSTNIAYDYLGARGIHYKAKQATCLRCGLPINTTDNLRYNRQALLTAADNIDAFTSIHYNRQIIAKLKNYAGGKPTPISLKGGE